MNAPIRIQRSRKKGWRMPPNTVCVTRPGKWGNPYYPGSGLGYGFFYENMEARQHEPTPAVCVAWFRTRMAEMHKCEPERFESYIAPLRGKNLACWCRLCERHSAGKPFGQACADCAPCHSDTLGELANGITCEPAS